METQKQLEKDIVWDDVLKLIEQRGFVIGDFEDKFPSNKKAAAKKSSSSESIKYQDPNNPTHTWIGKGVIPPWVKEQMNTKKLDPDKKGDRKKFRDTLKVIKG